MWTLLAAFVTCSHAHEYMADPPVRSGDILLNAVAMGTKFCHYPDKGVSTLEDLQCNDETDPAAWSRLFQVHPAWDSFACGGSTRVVGSSGSQGLMQAAGYIVSHPMRFDMSLEGPEAITQYTAGSDLEIKLKGFFHEGVMRISICFRDEMDCQQMSSYNKYVLGYHFTEGTAGISNIYDVELPFQVKLPNRNGKAVLQFLVDAEDVRSYVSCSDIELTGALQTSDEYTCNGHPLCNCTLGASEVHLCGSCPRGTAPTVTPTDGATGTDIVKQYKDQVGVDEFCALCITNGCPSTCGGVYKGFYQGDKCTNTPVITGCGNLHKSELPRFVSCTQETCTSSKWTPVPSPPPSPLPPPTPTPMPVPTPVPSASCPADSTIVDGACMWISGTGGFTMPMSAEAYCEYTNQGYFGYIWDSSVEGDFDCAVSADKRVGNGRTTCLWEDGARGVSIPPNSVPFCSDVASGRIGYKPAASSFLV